MKRVIVSVTNDITTDQRVQKVCNSLVNNGYNILLIGRKLKNSKKINREYKTKRIKLIFNKGFLFYVEFNIRLFFYLLFSKKDILLSNDLDTLLANYLIAKIQNKKLVFDSHELFSEIPELVNKKFVKSFWYQLEKILIPNLKNAYTVCNSIAVHYNNKYGTSFKVIKNLPTFKTLNKSSLNVIPANKKIILYQGAVNIGRGLNLLIDSLNHLENCVLVIIGNGDILPSLQKYIIDKKLESKVIFLGRIKPSKLHTITPNAHIGVSLEEDLGLNYRYALPNKIFDYIQAEVPILVSDLPEMSAIVKQYKVGEVLTNRTAEELAKSINIILTKDYSKELKKAKKDLIWENQEEDLLAIFKNAM